jgi:hypothetical protein
VVTGFQAEEIGTGGKSRRVKADDVRSSGVHSISQDSHALTKNVVHREANIGVQRKREVD